VYATSDDPEERRLDLFAKFPPSGKKHETSASIHALNGYFIIQMQDPHILPHILSRTSNTVFEYIKRNKVINTCLCHASQ
jgi:hypothetical protein